jgi:restriction system protein
VEPALAAAGFVATLAALRALGRAGHRRERRCVEGLLELDAAGFELEVAALMRRLGYRGVRAVGGPGDLSADIVCQDRWGRRVVVQCKRYRPDQKVGSPAVQQLIGMAQAQHRADRCVLVTTSGFTGPALELARRHGVELVDGAALGRLLGRGAGVKSR